MTIFSRDPSAVPLEFDCDTRISPTEKNEIDVMACVQRVLAAKHVPSRISPKEPPEVMVRTALKVSFLDYLEGPKVVLELSGKRAVHEDLNASETDGLRSHIFLPFSA
jgi:hypothetical protein